MGLKSTRYDEEFKQSLVALYNNGKNWIGNNKVDSFLEELIE